MTAALLALAPQALSALPACTVSAYLSGLDRRLSALARAAGGPIPVVTQHDAGQVRLRQRVLRAIEGDWDDGDENLVRGFLDRWSRPGEPPGEDARVLLSAVEAIAASQPRPQTVRFLLWALESALARSVTSATPGFGARAQGC